MAAEICYFEDFAKVAGVGEGACEGGGIRDGACEAPTLHVDIIRIWEWLT